jgi:hypothetical protein
LRSTPRGPIPSAQLLVYQVFLVVRSLNRRIPKRDKQERCRILVMGWRMRIMEEQVILELLFYRKILILHSKLVRQSKQKKDGRGLPCDGPKPCCPKSFGNRLQAWCKFFSRSHRTRDHSFYKQKIIFFVSKVGLNMRNIDGLPSFVHVHKFFSRLAYYRAYPTDMQDEEEDMQHPGEKTNGIVPTLQ